MKSQFAFVGFLALVGLTQSVPLVEKDFFWFQTEEGKVVPAFLKERSPPLTIEGPIEEDVIFWHYLPGQDESRQILPNCNDNCLSGFIKGAPLVLAAHGFGSSHTGGFGGHLRNGFGKKAQPFNLIFINWSKRAASPDYGSAVRNVPEVGEYIGNFLNFLVAEGAATVDQTHFIGHSLGAHLANYVSARANGGKLKTIFGLDPAWPLFDKKPDSERLDPSDADFVNVIHTSSGYLGFEERRGHVDFYPNGGKKQPGCGADVVGSCAHSRVYEFLGEAIGDPGAFPSCKCASWKDYDDGKCTCAEMVNMGWDTPRTAEGEFYLRTNANAPYGQR